MRSATDRIVAAKKAATTRKRNAAANKTTATRKANAAAKKRSNAAVKAVATRKAIVAAKKRSDAAKTASETRKRNALSRDLALAGGTNYPPSSMAPTPPIAEDRTSQVIAKADRAIDDRHGHGTHITVAVV